MELLEFKNPSNLIYFLIPFLFLFILILAGRKKTGIMKKLNITRKVRFKFTRMIIFTLALILIVFSLLGPQIFKGFEEVQKTGMDIYVLIDTSKSMLVEDIKPNRISRAKKIIENLLDDLKGDRVGFIPFSSDAYIQMPLTDDYELARMFLDVIDTEMIGGGGTNISAAITLANDSFERSSNSDKVILVLSDGEEHDTNNLDVLDKIKDDNLKIFTIGIGTQKGGLIPVYDSNEQKNKIDYKKDSEGNFVTSRLNAVTLQKLADSTKGSYYQSSLTGDEIDSLLKDISTLKRDTLITKRISKFTQLYQYFLGAGVILFILAFIIPERSKM